jgi:hypothetical protein
VLNVESIVVRVSIRAVAIAEPPRSWQYKQRLSHHRSMHACLVDFASYRAIIQEIETYIIELNR